MVRYSRQRECILRNLQSRRDHPTADMVYESVRMEQPNISLGTVYRNLALLSENGQIRKISTSAGPDRFDGFTKPHVHFICRHCGNIQDMDYGSEINLFDKTSTPFSGVVEGYELQFFGRCGDCLAIEKSK